MARLQVRHPRHPVVVGALAAAVLLGALLGTAFSDPDVAGSSTATHGVVASPSSVSMLTKARESLEVDLEDRSLRLVALTKDLSACPSLSSAHDTLLKARVTSDQSGIDALLAKVPKDASLNAVRSDRNVMRAYRIFSVLSTQVYETIAADATLVGVSGLSGEEITLLSEVSSLVGDPGYKNARIHYENLVSRLDGLAAGVTRAETAELAATPKAYPGDADVLSSANSTITSAEVNLAGAASDASLISLAAGATDS